MSSRSIALGSAVVLLCVGALAAAYAPSVHRAAALFPCRFASDRHRVSLCVFKAIRSELKSSTGDAMVLFSQALRTIPGFDTGNCHTLAHRVGDMAFYDLFVKDPDSVKFTYPFESTACEYAFYHGFYEHYFQENPDEKKIVETCSALPDGPPMYLKTIQLTCYHGAGHGLVMAQVDALPRSKDGDMAAYTEAPLRTCSLLEGLTQEEMRRCPLGVFAQIAQFQATKDFGFSFSEDVTKRFEQCNLFHSETRDMCVLITAIVSELKLDRTVEACGTIQAQSTFSSCVRGMVLGHFINEATYESFDEALQLCADPRIHERGERDTCYRQLMFIVHSHYRPTEKASLCSRFPPSQKLYCEIAPTSLPEEIPTTL